MYKNVKKCKKNPVQKKFPIKRRRKKLEILNV